MQYMLLIYEDDADRVEHMDERMPHCGAYVEAMKKAGIYVVGERLRGVGATTSVRVRAGQAHVVDGPYAEAKEQLGGFFLIEARDRQQAVELAASWPSARLGSIEVRPIEEVLREERRYFGPS